MKKFILLLLTVAMSSAVLFAQEKGKTQAGPKKTPEQRADNAANKLEKDLGLSAEQKARVRELALTRAQKMDELREKYKDQDKKVWQAERKKVRDDFHAGMKSVLSPEQYEKWEAQRKKQAEQQAAKAKKNKGKRGGKGPKTTTTDDPGDGEDPELDGE